MIRSEVKDRVARIRFDRPEKKNAITVAMYPMLGEALRAAEADPQVRVVMLHGTAECFTAGNDVHDFVNVPRKPCVQDFLHRLSPTFLGALGGRVLALANVGKHVLGRLSRGFWRHRFRIADDEPPLRHATAARTRTVFDNPRARAARPH